MKSPETPGTALKPSGALRQHRGASYTKVFDQRKRRVRGLWERNGAYYAQITVTDETSGRKSVRRTRLEDSDGNPVGTVADATMAMNKLKVQREDNVLKLSPKRTPSFAGYAERYLAYITALKNKSPGTIHRERSCINNLKEHLSELRLRAITKAVVKDYMAKRKGQEMSARSINIEVITLRNILRHAVDEGYLPELQIDGVEWLHHEPKKRRLVSHEEIERICNTAIAEAPITGQMLADFVKLMAYSGGRWAETLRLHWSDVDFERSQLTFGSDGLTKNRQARVVDFNTKLRKHLKQMFALREPDSSCLFPSPRRGNSDAHAVTFNKTLTEVRRKAGVPDFTCHLCRHFFISYCVMSGIDYMTIARWVGHRDGGVLIGKVYGHLSNEHAKRMAERFDFESKANGGGK